MKTRMRTMQGFTLIELLVVIAIIAILAAILFPVFISAKERTKTIQCMNNIKQLSTAALGYTNDWGDKFPPFMKFTTATTLDPNGIWSITILPYVKNYSIYWCPTVRKQKDIAWSLKLLIQLRNCGYGLNANLHFYPGDFDWNGYIGHPELAPSPASVGSVVHPTRTVLLGECSNQTAPFIGYMPGHGPLNDRHVAYRHINGSNMSFVDGHTMFIKMDPKVDWRGEHLWDWKDLAWTPNGWPKYARNPGF